MAKSNAIAKQMPFKGVPIMWVFSLTMDSLSQVTGMLTERWTFDNLQELTYKKIKSGSSTSTSDNLDINRIDNTIMRFPKESLIIDATNGTEVASDSGGTDASGLGEITAIINQTPLETAITSWTAFIADLAAAQEAGTKFLIIAPTGYTYDGQGTGTSRKPDGYVYMIGSLSADIEQKQSNGAGIPVTVTFAAQKVTMSSALTAVTFTGKGIAISRGGSTTIAAAQNVPVDLDSAGITVLAAGKVLIKANS
jgi:hypothetical protein